MTFEQKVQLVRSVMRDPDVFPRPGPRRKRLKELGFNLNDPELPRVLRAIQAIECSKLYKLDQPVIGEKFGN